MEGAELAPTGGWRAAGYCPTALSLSWSHRAQPPTSPPNFWELWSIESVTLALLTGGRGFGKVVAGATAWGSGLVQDMAELSRLPQR